MLVPNLAHIRDKVIRVACREVLPCKFDSPAATVMLLAIGLQESRFEHRQQIGGPARSFWQFEKGGGVRGVLTHPATKAHAQAVCVLRNIPATSDAVYARMLEDDLLGCCFARLLLYSDPAPLPLIGQRERAWEYYLRNWRPGKPHEKTWAALYSEAVDALV
jgi:hypothetical protein